jgi:hypothetical protein
MAISRMQEPRQLYGLGSLVKKITRPIKKIIKSPIGKIGLTALGGYALGGGFGAGGFKFGNILSKGKGLTSMFSKAKSALTGSNLFKGLTSGKGILAAGLGSGLLGGLLAKQPDEDEDEYQDRIMRLQPYLKQYYGNVGDTFGDQKISPNELEDFVTSQSIEYQGAKDGGLMGYEDGGVIMADVDEMKVGPEGEEDEYDVTMDEEMVTPTGFEKVRETVKDIAESLYKTTTPMGMGYKMAKGMYDRLPDISKQAVEEYGRALKLADEGPEEDEVRGVEPDEIVRGVKPDEIMESMIMVEGKKDGGIMNLGGKEMDLRGGGFVPLGKKERADDVPARLSKNEFVFTADAVRAAGGGSVQKGAQKMYDTMKMLEKRIR